MLGALIGAGANLLGGLIGKNDAESQQRKNLAAQKEFAQHGIRWKVEDAKAAGLHPLAALGAQTSSFSPISVGGSSLASGVSAAGQDIARAVDATRTQSEKMSAYTKTIQDLNIQRMGLENQLLSSQIAKVNQAGLPPPMPSTEDPYLVEGQTQSGINPQKLKRVNPPLGNPSIEPGAIVDTGFARTPTGWAPVMSKDVKDRLEEDLIGSLLWNIRNRLAPTFGSRVNPPNVSREPGEMWVYDPASQEYRKVKYVNPPMVSGTYREVRRPVHWREDYPSHMRR